MSETVLLDTHVWAWSLLGVGLTAGARLAMEMAAITMVSPVSMFEICQKVRLGKWPDMEPKVPTLQDALAAQGGRWADVTPDLARLAGSLDWPHRDPFDRLLAATALINGWVLLSADPVFDSLTGLRRVW
jgi:PIN domain nuclease of toxin-antitoxin system